MQRLSFRSPPTKNLLTGSSLVSSSSSSSPSVCMNYNFDVSESSPISAGTGVNSATENKNYTVRTMNMGAQDDNSSDGVESILASPSSAEKVSRTSRTFSIINSFNVSNNRYSNSRNAMIDDDPTGSSFALAQALTELQMELRDKVMECEALYETASALSQALQETDKFLERERLKNEKLRLKLSMLCRYDEVLFCEDDDDDDNDEIENENDNDHHAISDNNKDKNKQKTKKQLKYTGGGSSRITNNVKYGSPDSKKKKTSTRPVSSGYLNDDDDDADAEVEVDDDDDDEEYDDDDANDDENDNTSADDNVNNWALSKKKMKKKMRTRSKQNVSSLSVTTMTMSTKEESHKIQMQYNDSQTNESANKNNVTTATITTEPIDPIFVGHRVDLDCDEENYQYVEHSNIDNGDSECHKRSLMISASASSAPRSQPPQIHGNGKDPTSMLMTRRNDTSLLQPSSISSESEMKTVAAKTKRTSAGPNVVSQRIDLDDDVDDIVEVLWDDTQMKDGTPPPGNNSSNDICNQYYRDVDLDDRQIVFGGNGYNSNDDDRNPDEDETFFAPTPSTKAENNDGNDDGGHSQLMSTDFLEQEKQPQSLSSSSSSSITQTAGSNPQRVHPPSPRSGATRVGGGKFTSSNDPASMSNKSSKAPPVGDSSVGSSSNTNSSRTESKKKVIAPSSTLPLPSQANFYQIILERDVAQSSVKKLSKELKHIKSEMKQLKSRLDLSTALVEISYAGSDHETNHTDETAVEQHGKKKGSWIRGGTRKGNNANTTTSTTNGSNNNSTNSNESQHPQQQQQKHPAYQHHLTLLEAIRSKNNSSGPGISTGTPSTGTGTGTSTATLGGARRRGSTNNDNLNHNSNKTSNSNFVVNRDRLEDVLEMKNDDEPYLNDAIPSIADVDDDPSVREYMKAIASNNDADKAGGGFYSPNGKNRRTTLQIL